MEPLEKFLHWHVDVHHLVGLLDERVGNRVVDFDTGDPPDQIVEALQVLNTESTDDVNTVLEKLEHVLIPARVSRIGWIGVGQVVDDHHLGTPGKNRVQVEIFRGDSSEPDDMPGHDLEPRNEGHGLGPTPRVDETENHVDATNLQVLGFLKHAMRLANARRRADEELQPAPPSAFNELEEVGGAFHQRCRWYQLALSPRSSSTPSSTGPLPGWT